MHENNFLYPNSVTQQDEEKTKDNKDTPNIKVSLHHKISAQIYQEIRGK
jgi:hypothetical protein